MTEWTIEEMQEQEANGQVLIFEVARGTDIVRVGYNPGDRWMFIHFKDREALFRWIDELSEYRDLEKT